MALYQTRVQIREAIQYTGDNLSLIAVKLFTGHWLSVGDDQVVRITTPNGSLPVDAGDWIVKAGPGDFYPCKPDVFAATYDPV